MADAVGRVGGAANRFLAEILGMSAKTSLCDMAVLSTGERYTVMFQIDYGFRRLFGEQFGRVLVDEPIAAFDRVEVVQCQSSFSTLPRLAAMPPSAEPVCERNGWSLEITRMFGSMPASFRACICSLRSIPNAADRPAAPAPTITASYISSTCFGLIATIFAQGVTSLRFAGWRVCRCMRGYACLMRMFSMDSVDLCRLGGGVVGRDVMWRLRR